MQTTALWKTAMAGTEDSREAFLNLSRSYWYPVFAWWRRAGLPDRKAARATEACIERWLGESAPSPSDEGARHFRDWIHAQLPVLAAGGVKLRGAPPLGLDLAWAESRYAHEPEGDPDAIFERRWALTVLEFAMKSLESEFAERDEAGLFRTLAPFLSMGAGGNESCEAAAGQAGMSAGTVNAGVFDLRRRFHEVLRALVGQTVSDPGEIDGEIAALESAPHWLNRPAECGSDPPDAIDWPEGLDAGALLSRGRRELKMTPGGTCSWTPPAVEEAARLFPHFEILELLGCGGTAAVFRARQLILDRFVAIKLMPLEISANPEFAERFTREAQTLGQLSHPNIVSVFGFGKTHEGHLYIVMECVEGSNLHDCIHGAGLEPKRAIEILQQVCEGVGYAHRHGVVHRDLKPGNVLVTPGGEVKVGDFGLARVRLPGAARAARGISGTIIGTPDYMAPEHTRSMDVDQRADIYSLGVLLYEALCRETPRGVFDPPSVRAGVSPRIDAVIEKAMRQERDRRFQSALEMKLALTMAVEAGDDPGDSAGAKKKRRRPAMFAALAAMLTVALGGIFLFREKPAASGPSPAPPAAALAAANDSPSAKPAPAPAKVRPLPPPPLDADPDADGFRPLFDGRTFAGWRGYRDAAAVKGWRVEDGALIAQPRAFLVTQEIFGDFELVFEWQSDALSDGGVFFRIAEEKGGGALPLSAPEFQIMDDAVAGPFKTGALAGVMHAANALALPPGEWNTGRIVVTGAAVEHYVNGALACRFTLDASLFQNAPHSLPAFRDDPDYGRALRGRIGLQAWAGRVAYRGLRIRPPVLKKAEALVQTAAPKLDPDPGPEPAPASEPESGPEPPAQPENETARWLAAREPQWRQVFGREVTAPFDKRLAALNEEYVAAIDRQLALAAGAREGSLEDAVFLKDERSRIAAGGAVPAGDDAATPGWLRQVRVNYRKRMALIERDRLDRARSLHRRVDAMLARSQAGLTRQQRFEEALLVKQQRETLAAEWLPAPAESPEPDPPRPLPAP